MQFVAEKSGYHFTLLCFSSISPAQINTNTSTKRVGGGKEVGHKFCLYAWLRGNARRILKSTILCLKDKIIIVLKSHCSSAGSSNESNDD